MSAVLATVRGLFLNVMMGTALLSAFAWADQLSVPRIGVLTAGTSVDGDLRDGLRELGYIEGNNISIEWRRVLGTSAETNEELHSLVADLASSNVDLIVVSSTPAARTAALRATTVPLVFVVGDPVGAGLAASLARPSGQGSLPKRCAKASWRRYFLTRSTTTTGC